MTPLSPAQVDHNCLVVCCAVISMRDLFVSDGAVNMNHLLQERAGLNREQAFQVVADAIDAGLVRMIDGTKALELVHEAFVPFRDRMIDRIGAVESEVVTLTWTIFAPRVVSEEVREQLRRHVARGRLAELGGTLAGRTFVEVERLLETAVAAGIASDMSQAERQDVEAAARLLVDAIDERTEDDFVAVVVRSRDSGSFRCVKFPKA